MELAMTIFGNGQEADPFPGERSEQRTQPMTVHTPTPWATNIHASSITGDDRHVIAEMCGKYPVRQADAALIVEAVNNYAVLKARIEEMNSLLRLCLSDYSHPNFTDRHGMADRIRATLSSGRRDNERTV
jgi:hypothetical protein